MTNDDTEARLLPWASPEGNPCYLVTDGTGYVSRLADTVEAMQLGMAGDLLDHAADLLADRRATPDQLRFLLARMSEALTDVRRKPGLPPLSEPHERLTPPRRRLVHLERKVFAGEADEEEALEFRELTERLKSRGPPPLCAASSPTY